jgi:hypothetical protein
MMPRTLGHAKEWQTYNRTARVYVPDYTRNMEHGNRVLRDTWRKRTAEALAAQGVEFNRVRWSEQEQVFVLDRVVRNEYGTPCDIRVEFTSTAQVASEPAPAPALIRLRNGAKPLRCELFLDSDFLHGEALCQFENQYVIWDVWESSRDELWDCGNGRYFDTLKEALHEWYKPFHGRSYQIGGEQPAGSM